MMEPESWKDIHGYEGRYRVSTLGNVFSVRSNRTLKPWKNGNGYYAVLLMHNGKVESWRIHRLVLTMFIGPCPNGMEASHLNGIRTDNRAENLAWETPEKNLARRFMHGNIPYGEKCSHSKLTLKQAKDIIEKNHAGKSINALAREYGIAVDTAWGIITGKYWAKALMKSQSAID